MQNVQMLRQQGEKPLDGAKQDVRPLKTKDYLGRVWRTGPRPEIDRVGSAWLIRRFMDPEARFVFGDSPKSHSSAIPYDLYDVEFSHHGDDCTFETLIRCFRIQNRTVKVLVEMIHDADLEDRKFQSMGCVGLN